MQVAATTLACTPSKNPPAVSQCDAGKPLEAFSGKQRHETDLQALNNDLVGVVRATMQPPLRLAHYQQGSGRGGLPNPSCFLAGLALHRPSLGFPSRSVRLP